MSFQSKQGIVPQLRKSIGVRVQRLFTLILPVSALVLAACSTVQLQAAKPQAPNTLEQARAYVAEREKQLEFLEYELNEQSRACYKKFFVSSCLDDVRLQGAQIRRAHLEVQGKADDMIRLDEYANRRARTPD
jgi:cell division protein FtsL